MLAVRAPQSNPPMIALPIFSASIRFDGVDGECRLLPVARRIAGQKPRRAVAAQIRYDDAITCGHKPRRDLSKRVDVIGPSMKEEDRGTLGRPDLRVADIQVAGVDLFDIERIAPLRTIRVRTIRGICRRGPA